MKTYVIIKCVELSDQYECDADRRIWFVGSRQECEYQLQQYFKSHKIKDRFNLEYKDYDRDPLLYELYECDNFKITLIETNTYMQ